MRASPVLLSALVLAGCGGGGAARVQPPEAPHVPRAAQMKAIVRAWSEHLNAGDNAAIASLPHPSAIAA